MVTWQSTLNRDHSFEVLVQERIPGEGKGAKCWRWIRNYDPLGAGTKVMKALLVAKLRRVADKLDVEIHAHTETFGPVQLAPGEVSWLLPLVPTDGPN